MNKCMKNGWVWIMDEKVQRNVIEIYWEKIVYSLINRVFNNESVTHTKWATL